MAPALILGLLAGLIHLSAFLVYNRQMLKGTSAPNTATWLLWSFIVIINSATYIVMCDDWVKGIITIVSSVACVGTFVFALFKGKLSKLNAWDTAAFVVGFAVMVLWILFKNTTFAHLLLQSCFIISVIPTYRGVIQNPKNEKWIPWFMWSSAYTVSAGVVFMRWTGHLEDLVHPALSILTHLGVGILSLRKTDGANL